MNYYLIEILSFWGIVIVGSVATLKTVLTSKDLALRKYAIFNLTSFLIRTLAIQMVLAALFINYSSFFSLHESWVPFQGFKIIGYFIFADFLFYVYHRLEHVIPYLWSGHSSHHSGEIMHVSLILRQNVIANIFTLPFGLLGIPFSLNPLGISACIKFIIFYQSLIHFTVKRDVPILNYVFVTPYNHIIHHSALYEGAGQNYGGILNIWDRFCGTYRTGSKYLEKFGIPGLKNPDNLWNLNFYHILQLLRDCWDKRSIRPFFIPNHIKFKSNVNLPTTLAYTFCLSLTIFIIVKFLAT